MNILILGASGFIGRNMMWHFAKDKANNVLVHCKSRIIDPLPENVKFIQWDLTTANGVEEVFSRAKDYFSKSNGGEIDTVIQAAATTSGAKDTFSKPYYHVTDNAVMNSLILREELKYNIKNHIFFSCTVMYSGQDGVVNEGTVIDKIDPKYFGVGWTKVYLEKMCKFFSTISKTKFTVIRHSNIYGPYDKYDLEHSHFFGANVTKVLTTPVGGDIVVWGDGKDTRDFLAVQDLCNFVELALKKQDIQYELYNVGSGINYTTNQIVEKIINISKRNQRILNDIKQPSIPISFTLNTSKARAMGWKAETGIDEGIRQTIEWYNNFYGNK
jgi:nucleoside-diphosphate-sugar epimerase